MNYQELSNEELIDECRRASNGDWMSGLKAELRRRLDAGINTRKITPAVLTIVELSHTLKITPKEIRAHVASGSLRPICIGDRDVFTLGEVQRFIDANTARLTQAERLQAELRLHGISIEDLAAFPDLQVNTEKIKQVASGDYDVDPSVMPNLIATIAYAGERLRFANQIDV